jgi:hypothetical protein
MREKQHVHTQTQRQTQTQTQTHTLHLVGYPERGGDLVAEELAHGASLRVCAHDHLVDDEVAREGVVGTREGSPGGVGGEG